MLAIYIIWVDDGLKALAAQGIRLHKAQPRQKATLAELHTIALFVILMGMVLSKGYLLAQGLLLRYFPSLPHLSRFLRTLQKTSYLLAHLALSLAQKPNYLHMVDLKPIPLAHGHRLQDHDLPGSRAGVGVVSRVMCNRTLPTSPFRGKSPLAGAARIWYRG